MKLRKFYGTTSRAVLQQVRNELGADAVIVANKTTDDGIEITALAHVGFEAMMDSPPPPVAAADEIPTLTNTAAMDDFTPALGEPRAVEAPTPRKMEAPTARRMEAPIPRRMEAPIPRLVEPLALRDLQPSSPRRAESSTPGGAQSLKPLTLERLTPFNAEPALRRSAEPSVHRGVEPAMLRAAESPAPVLSAAPLAPPGEDAGLGTRLLAEVASLRAMLEDQLAQLAWSDTLRRKPLRARITRDLLASGYSARVARSLSQQLADDCGPTQAVEWLTRAIAREISCVDPSDDIVARGGVYALVGPTGVGKTTTVAKIAARCAVRYGAQSLALLTTDSYRVGAQDQLRIFAKILGVTVHTVADGQDLRGALELLHKKHFVLIDTVGMGQRDARLAEQSTLLAQPTVRRMLLLNATAQSETLEEVVSAYGGPTGLRSETLAGCIITKLDEAARPGHVLDVVIRNRLPLLYVSNGQRVPEDLHAPSAAYLAHRSLRKAPDQDSDSPFALNNDELGCLIGAEVAHV